MIALIYAFYMVRFLSEFVSGATVKWMKHFFLPASSLIWFLNLPYVIFFFFKKFISFL